MTRTDSSFVTVVSGVPRSGTSMAMQMLEAGGMPVLADHQRAADEDNRKGYFELESVKRTKHDAAWLSEAPGKVVKVVYMLLYDLPADFEYRVLFMRRNLAEVVASQQAMLARRAEKGASVSADQMVGVFQRQLEKADDWLAEQPNFEVLDVDYHQVVSDPQSEAAKIAEFLGTGLDEAKMAAAVDAKLYRNRQS